MSITVNGIIELVCYIAVGVCVGIEFSPTMGVAAVAALYILSPYIPQ